MTHKVDRKTHINKGEISIKILCQPTIYSSSKLGNIGKYVMYLIYLFEVIHTHVTRNYYYISLKGSK